jgi:hypothetical protein
MERHIYAYVLIGNTVKYKNFKHGRKDNLHHNVEDCVVLSPTTGKRDDVECGGDNAISESIKGIRHAFICQYGIVLSFFIVIKV